MAIVAYNGHQNNRSLEARIATYHLCIFRLHLASAKEELGESEHSVIPWMDCQQPSSTQARSCPASPPTPQPNQQVIEASRKLTAKIEKAVLDLYSEETRGPALKELSDIYRDLKPPQLSLILLQAASVLVILLFEITDAATRLHTNQNSMANYKRTAECITLIKCLLEQSEGRKCLLAANVLYYLCLFLHATVPSVGDVELIQLSIYHIFLTLIKIDPQSFMRSVDDQEIIPSTLRIIERGEDKCVVVAAHFLLTLMSCDEFTNKITAKKERLEHFLLVMRKASQHALEKRKIILHKIVLKALLCLTKKKSSLRPMREHLLPHVERSDLLSFSEENESTLKWHRTLLQVMRPEKPDVTIVPIPITQTAEDVSPPNLRLPFNSQGYPPSGPANLHTSSEADETINCCNSCSAEFPLEQFTNSSLSVSCIRIPSAPHSDEAISKDIVNVNTSNIEPECSDKCSPSPTNQRALFDAVD